MSLLDDVNAAINQAMKAKDQERLGPLRMLKAALVNRRVEKGHELDQIESLQIVTTLVKQRREAIEQFGRGGRQDLVDKETAEIRVLETYLPPAVDPGEIERVIEGAIAETGAASPQDLGKVMKVVMSRLAGRGVDGKVVNELVRAKLSR